MCLVSFTQHDFQVHPCCSTVVHFFLQMNCILLYDKLHFVTSLHEVTDIFACMILIYTKITQKCDYPVSEGKTVLFRSEFY